MTTRKAHLKMVKSSIQTTAIAKSCFRCLFLARYVRRQKELQRAKTNAAKSVQLAMQRFGLILGHRRSASAVAMKSVKTKGASQERASAAQPEGRIW